MKMMPTARQTTRFALALSLFATPLAAHAVSAYASPFKETTVTTKVTTQGTRVTVTGTGNADEINLRCVGTSSIRIEAISHDSTGTASVGIAKTITAKVFQVVVNTKGGSDSITLPTTGNGCPASLRTNTDSFKFVVNAGAGNDTVRNSFARDKITGGAGSDMLYGWGNDVLVTDQYDTAVL